MSKDSYWFRHDSNARNDIKILRLRAIYGWEGYGVYFALIEWLREQDGYRLIYTDSEINILANTMNIDFSRLKNIINDCIKINLFFVKNGFFMSQSLIDRMSLWETKKRNGSELKAKSKLNRSETEAKQEQKRREEERIGDNSKVGGNSTSTPNPLFPLKTNGIKPKRLANGGKVAFEDSPIFDRKAFKDRFPDWPKSKLKHYYESAEAYSTEGHKYVDWGKAINIWASRDEKKNKYRFEPDNKSDQDITIQFLNRM